MFQSKIVQAYTLIISISLSTYFGIFSENEGLNNIGLTLIWVLGILLVISVFGETKKTNNKDKAKGFNKYLLRAILLVSVMSMLYGGHIFLGLVYIVAIIIVIAGNLKTKDSN